MKIVTILGARPQFIKAGSVSREIAKYEGIQEIIVHTGQHFDANMSDIFFAEMQIPEPNYNLNINGLRHGAMTGQILEKIEEVLIQENPDWVMVYGDTNSTIAGALAASKLYIKVVHIEAGLRSFNMNMPEEINRILTDRISNILFCPTDTAVQNLLNEGYIVEGKGGIEKREGFGKVINVGDVMQDGAMFYKDFAKKPSNLKLETSNYILCTIHRAENTDDEKRLTDIFDALNEIAKDKQIVLPLHPRTKRLLPSSFSPHPNIKIMEPVGYLGMVWLIDHCDLVMTDSGGLQKEAYFFRKPCITLRDETEWVELVEGGFNVLVGADKEKIIDSFKNYRPLYSNSKLLNLYGEGKASKRIVMELLK